VIKVIDSVSKNVTHRTESSLLRKKYEPLLKAYLSSRIGKVILALCLLLFLGGIYLYASRIVLHNSDNASILLQAYDFIHTSKILKGWYLPTDNFITIDIPLYAFGLLLGLKMPVLMKIVPSFLFTGVTLLGIYLELLLGKTGKQKMLSALAFAAIIVFPSYDAVIQILQGPIHVGTILGTLLAFIAYYFYKERPYKIVSLLILGILTVLLVIGDPMSDIILVFPILLVEVLFLYKRKFRSRSEYMIIGTVLLSTLFALYMLHIGKNYVYTQTISILNFETVATIVKNAQIAIQLILVIFHGDVFQQNAFSLKIIPELVNAAFVVLLGIGIWKWLKKIFSLETSRDALTALLVFALLGNIAAFVFTDIADAAILRYLIPAFVFGGILAFSMLSYIKKPELYVIIIGLFLLNSALFFYMLYHTLPAVQPETSAISFLQEKHLTKGIGEYWSATAITGQSNYAITIRQVKVLHQRIHPALLLANDSWFHDDALKDSQFIIYKTTDKGFYAASVGSFGKPDHVYKVGIYVILAWNTPLFSHARPGYHFYVTS
jgi:hypothetical protein